MHQQFEYLGFKFEWKELVLKMKKTWITSHSVSQTRSNFLVTITLGNITGRGQAGLPPKKPGCYLADVNDCFDFMRKLEECLQKQEFVVNNQILDVENYFQQFRTHIQKENYYKVLSALHHLMQPVFRAAVSACEFALFDLWAQMLKRSLFECIHGYHSKLNFKSFCSVSIGENQVEEAKQTSKLTPYIKLKFQNNLETIKKNLTQIFESNAGRLYVLDANASWSIETTQKVIEFIAEKGYQDKIHCLEQPYDVYPVEQWKNVFALAKEKGINIMSDESFTNADDIEKVKAISNGVNIKIEKTGGLIEAIKTARSAKEAKLEIWLGIMISSWLGCAQTYMLAPFSHYGDLDAGLLVWSPFAGGFESTPDGILLPVQGTGLAIRQINPG